MWSPPGMADRARAAGSQSRAAAGTEICPDQALVVRVRVHRVWRGEVRVSARRAQAVRAGVLACRVPWAKARVSARRALWAKAGRDRQAGKIQDSGHQIMPACRTASRGAVRNIRSHEHQRNMGCQEGRWGIHSGQAA